MKGLTLVSKAYENYFVDRYQHLFEMIRDEYGFDIQYTDSPEVPADVDMLFVALQRTYTNSMMSLEHLDRKVKMIGLIGDIHSLDYNGGNGVKMLARYDVILVNALETALRTYPQFAKKMVHFPSFFATHDRYTKLPYDNNRIMRCLLTGSMKPPREYPLRFKIARYGDPRRIIQLPHPMEYHIQGSMIAYRVFRVGDRFAQILSTYFCCVTSSESPANELHPTLRVVIAKHVEIPAAGSLLLVEPCEDARLMGFVPGENYVPVEIGNVFERIYEVLDNPEKYESVRRAGMELVREKHSINNRMDMFREVMKSL